MNCTNPLIAPGSTVAVLGYGITGSAAVDYAIACGAVVIVSDSSDADTFTENGKVLTAKRVEFETGGHSLDFLQRASVVMLSPGISYNSPVVNSLKEKGILVLGELGILAPVLKKTKVVAITGSNGKTTVTSLIGEALQKTGYKTFIGGNIGTPLYRYFTENNTPDEIIVAEVSSFQLECAGDFAPDVSILLNITPDHLTRHGGFANYIAAKMQIFAKQGADHLAVINADDPNSQINRKDFPVSFKSFGVKPDSDAFIERDHVFLLENGKRRLLHFPSGTAGFSSENFAAAALALRAMGLSFVEIEERFAEFRRPAHRMEEVAEIGGVLYINDSKATNTGAVIGALKQFTRPVILIAGGRDKGEDYHQLCEMVEDKVRAVIVIGESANDIAAALQSVTDVHHAESLPAAVQLGSRLAHSGDVVLLSPACASFDMFSGYDQRGCCFRDAVTELQRSKK